MQLVDTHCHIHEAQPQQGDDPSRNLWVKAGNTDPDAIITRATEKGVTRMICVGTNAADSELAVQFVRTRPQCWASVGLHPHEAKDLGDALPRLKALLAANAPTITSAEPRPRPFPQQNLSDVSEPAMGAARLARVLEGQDWQARKIVAIGECGLDFFYDNSPKKDQIAALHAQIELAIQYDLPLIFHVRNALDDFWPIFDSYPNLRGVLHSFTDTQANLDKALARGLYIGANGIMTFTKNKAQLDMAKNIPLQKLLIETDAPFLTPHPFRGNVNEPAHASLVATFLCQLRGESLTEFAAHTTANAQTLFNL